MIIVKLKGGLGNQMFQYACGRSLAEALKVPLKLDLSFFETSTAKLPEAIRTFDLNAFNITAEIASSEELSSVSRKTSIFSKIVHRLSFSKNKPVVPSDPSPGELQKNPPKYLNGYFQSEEYFKNIETLIRSEFTPRNPLSLHAETVGYEISKVNNSVSMHIRRGDYVSVSEINKQHGTCSPEYYSQAARILKHKIGPFTLFVFSDDIAWVKNNIPFTVETVYVSDPKALHPFEELLLQSKCNHHIIANSSFSWWGAWLGTHPEKVVIAPKKWFANAPTPTNLIPPTWIQM